jgi:hypothetical protein
MSALRHVWAGGNPEHLERVLRICTLSGLTPISSTLIRGADLALRDDQYKDVAINSDELVAAALGKIGTDYEKAAEDVAADCGLSKYHGMATMLAGYVIDWDNDAQAA